MADKLVWVRAASRGQLPDRTWRDPSDPPFQVPESLASARWMVRLPALDMKAAKEPKRQTKGDEPEAS